MKIRSLMLTPLALVLVAGACTAEQTQEGELPEVNVEGGQAPQYDVNPAEVNVGTDTQTVVTPEVDVVPANEAATPQP